MPDTTSAATASLVLATRHAPAWLEALVRKLVRALLRIEVRGIEHYPLHASRVIIIANHVSLLDGLLLYLFLPEKPCFMLNRAISRRFRFLLSFCDMFLIDPFNPMSLKGAIRHVQSGQRLVIFPEGRITTTGALMKIYPGAAMIVEMAGALIVPVAIDGPQYSFFSYLRGRLRQSLRPRIHCSVLPPRQLAAAPGAPASQRRQHIFHQLEQLMCELGFRAWPHRRGLYPALLEAVARHGASTAAIREPTGHSLSYRALLMRATALGRRLQTQLGTDSHIGLLLPNTGALVVCFWALQRLGKVPAMLNYSAGPAGCLGACKTAGIHTILSSRTFIAKARLQALAEALHAQHRLLYLEDLAGTVRLSDKLAGLWHGLCPRLPPTACQAPDRTAVLLFTSGSEGPPKGVALSHANLLANYAQVRCQLDFNRNDLVFCCLPMFHAFGLHGGLLLPLLAGTPVLLYPSPLDYRNIPEQIYEHHATILFSTNTFLTGYAQRAHPGDFQSLRFVAAGAEKLTPQTWQLWARRFGICVYQGYGVTETGPVIAVNTPLANRVNSTGQLLPDMEYYLQPVEGIARGGRLVVRGPNVMLGYLQADSQDVVAPATERGEGWYDTGDLAEVDADGYLHILGRIKRFAKIGGEMVPLGTIEELAALCWPEQQHASIAVSDPRRGERVILITEARQAELGVLRHYVREQGHPELFVPAALEIVDALPLLGSGKPDYRVLQQRFSAPVPPHESDSAGPPPTDPSDPPTTT